MSKPVEVWVLILEPLEEDTPDLRRLVARALKEMLRRHGLKCVRYGGPELLIQGGQDYGGEASATLSAGPHP